jgi:hypothetical protein
MSDETNVPVELLRFNFTPEDLTLLAEYKEEWQLANRTKRSQIATRAFQDMKKANKNWKDADKKLKKDVGSSLNNLKEQAHK